MLNIRRILIGSSVALLVVVSILVVGFYLVRQNYKRHHYITGTRQFGRYRGQKYRYTEEQQDEMSREVTIADQRSMDAANKLREAHPR